MNDDDEDVYTLAKAYFDNKEFQRAAHFLDAWFSDEAQLKSALQRRRARASNGAGSSPGGDASLVVYPPKAFFLRCYSLYLDGERRRETEQAQGGDGLARTKPAVNPSLQPLIEVLVEAQHGGRLAADPFSLWLLGTVLQCLGRKEEAKEALLAAAIAYPLNWSAWVGLATVCKSKSDVDRLSIPSSLAAHWAVILFRAHAYTEIQAHTSALKELGPLSALFPRSSFVKSLVGRALYNLRKMDAATAIFESISAADPHRYDDADTQSNILYVNGNMAALAALAHGVFASNRYTPQACVCVGNYYSARGEHEKAVIYFRRALRVDVAYQSAWTLLGHEYVELRNTGAAVECYRRAVDANDRDYRAWYGLGQTYELLQMYLYAMYYYRRAAALRPYDARMWSAMGACCEHLDRRGDAIACYERAAKYSDGGADSGAATLKLARLYRSAGNVANACRWFAAYVEDREEEDGEGGNAGAAPSAQSSSDMAESLMYLARCAKDEGRYADAEVYASRVVSLPVPGEVREARSLLNELRMVKGAGQQQHAGDGSSGGGSAALYIASSALQGQARTGHPHPQPHPSTPLFGHGAHFDAASTPEFSFNNNNNNNSSSHHSAGSSFAMGGTIGLSSISGIDMAAATPAGYAGMNNKRAAPGRPPNSYVAASTSAGGGAGPSSSSTSSSSSHLASTVTSNSLLGGGSDLMTPIQTAAATPQLAAARQLWGHSGGTAAPQSAAGAAPPQPRVGHVPPGTFGRPPASATTAAGQGGVPASAGAGSTPGSGIAMSNSSGPHDSGYHEGHSSIDLASPSMQLSFESGGTSGHQQQHHTMMHQGRMHATPAGSGQAAGHDRSMMLFGGHRSFEMSPAGVSMMQTLPGGHQGLGGGDDDDGQEQDMAVDFSDQ